MTAVLVDDRPRGLLQPLRRRPSDPKSPFRVGNLGLRRALANSRFLTECYLFSPQLPRFRNIPSRIYVNRGSSHRE